MERLGLATVPGAGWAAEQIEVVAREAEAAGFDAIFAETVMTLPRSRLIHVLSERD